MEVDRTHTKKGSQQHYLPVLEVESLREKEQRETEDDMEEDCG